jgi:hypothetical protein
VVVQSKAQVCSCMTAGIMGLILQRAWLSASCVVQVVVSAVS